MIYPLKPHLVTKFSWYNQATLSQLQQIAKWLLKSGRKITTLLRSLFAYPRFLFYADGFLDQMLGASFDHCIPQTGVLKLAHGNVLLET